MVEKSAAALVEEYVDCILKQRDAIHSGTIKDVRRQAKKMNPTAKKLLRMGDEGLREFATLLSHPDWEVRARAACSLVSFLPEEALVVFRQMAESSNPMIAMAGKMRIKEWEEHPEHYDPENWAK